MRRGDIYLVSLDPAAGWEQTKRRPAVIVSSDAANDSADRRGHGVVTVVPVTSNVQRVYAFQVLLRPEDSGLSVNSKVQAEQVRSISTERFIRRLGEVSAPRMNEIDDALRLHLAL